MLTQLRSRLASTTGDSGISLSELLVTMGLMTIAGSMATAFLVTSSKASNMTLERGYNVSQARLTLDSWTNLLKVTDSIYAPGSKKGQFVRITPTEIKFYASLNNRDNAGFGTPTLVDLSLENGELVERHYDGATGALRSTRNLASGAAATGWVFTPYAGTSKLPLTEQDCLSGSAHVDGFCGAFDSASSGTAAGETQLETVTRVDIAFTVTDHANLAPTSFTSSAWIGGS